MPFHLNRKYLQDINHTTLTEQEEVRYWVKSLGCTEEQLNQAIKAAASKTIRISSKKK